LVALTGDGDHVAAELGWVWGRHAADPSSKDLVLAGKESTEPGADPEAKGLKWGAQLNTTGAAYIADTIKPTTEARVFNTTVDAFTALNAGQIQAVLLDTPIVLGAVKEKQIPDGEVVGQFKTDEQYGAVLNRDSKNLDAINQVIKTLKSEGFIDQLLQKYFSDQVSVPVIG
jgi:polar amino acid transport system substrate-binding protein